MACIVLLVIILMSIVLDAELGPKADPTTTTYAPRPGGTSSSSSSCCASSSRRRYVALATIGIPTVCMILLFLLPFYDRGPERRPERRPVATLTAILIIGAMAYLTYEGAAAGPPTQIDLSTPSSVIAEGPKVVAQY